jgi:ATP-dependent Zn protease
VRDLIGAQLARAQAILKGRSAALQAIGSALLTKETLRRPELEALAGIS